MALTVAVQTGPLILIQCGLSSVVGMTLEGVNMREIEKKYGKNDMNALIICPRCADAVPDYLLWISL